tara:strand:+ start:93 stop:686 length:594 start_codon:yes stop_codon:yes gene_type:complete
MAVKAIIITKFLFISGLLTLPCFLAGLQHFVLNLPRTSSSIGPAADGIVVITGGQQRLSDGLRLLQIGAGKALLVSGVGRGVSKSILADELDLGAPAMTLMDCCVTLEFRANNTRGNALAAAQWAAKNKFQSLRLVTSNYHMPRAKRVFTSKMPDIELYFWPVSPADLTLKTWWQKPDMIRLLAREYAKYLTEHLRV